MQYSPDYWVLVKIYRQPEEPHYRVLAGWSGGYTNGSSWKLSSAITKFEDADFDYNFYGSSGSVYVCCKASERLSGAASSVLTSLSEQNSIEVVGVEEFLDNHLKVVYSSKT